MALGAIVKGIGKVASWAAPAALEVWNTWQQKKQQDWQIEAQKKTWQREDTAQQRAVKDLRAAGLSPTLAAGHGAPTSTPTQPKPPNFSQERVLNLMKMKADISQTYAQTELIKAQAKVATESQDSMVRLNNLKAEQAALQYQLDAMLKSGRGGTEQYNQLLLQTRKLEYEYEELKHNLGIARTPPVRMTTDHNPYLQLGSSAAQSLWMIGKSALDYAKGRDVK